ncbi:GFA family protein [Bradyrhizobium uaiense]|uniref:GFA family protein n=1 Tax=Bradyrhizobium uaiense TaxID=2594946 RepID=A0A6P1BF94_9BRAD|nr:GFA family protein [Bradyrhizobium uaiense]NEU97196.1 GFA family protein [Bradyrhizobium uaiense]
MAGDKIPREEQVVTASENSNANSHASSKHRILTGECFCRDVRYEVADAFGYALNCHCSNCRRTTGSAFKPFAGIVREEFTVTSGAEGLLVYGDDTTHDAHCGRCGSLLYSRLRNGAYVHVTMGTLRDAPTIRPTAHIFVGSKAPWHEILDDLPQCQEHVTQSGE